MGKKSFAEKIKDDFKPVSLMPETGTPLRERTKAVPGARLIPLTDITPDPEQPRKKFDRDKLEELAASIESKGVIEPITVKFVEGDGKYRIVTGERRYKAAKTVGLKEIPCIIKELTDDETVSFQLVENLQREDLSPVDEAAALRKLLDTGLTQVKVSKLIGKSQSYISQSLKILELPESILKQAEKQNLTKEHLVQLSKADNPESLLLEIKEGKTAKEIREKIREDKPTKGRPKAKPWVWKPEDKLFTVQIRFKKSQYHKEQVIQALQELIHELKKGMS